MKLHEIMDPVSAAKEIEDLHAQMVDATSEYRALRTPASLKKLQDLEAKIQKILVARGETYNGHNSGNLEEDLRQMTPYLARSEINKIAYKLKIASGELMRRFKRRLELCKGDKNKAVRTYERDLNVPPGTLKGFDTLYGIATSA